MAWFRDNLGVGALGWCLWKVFELVCSCLILQLLCCLRLLHFQTFVGRLTFQIDHSYSLASPFCSNVKRRLPVVVSSIRLRKGRRWSSSHKQSNHMSTLPCPSLPMVIANVGSCVKVMIQQDMITIANFHQIAPFASVVHLGSMPMLVCVRKSLSSHMIQQHIISIATFASVVHLGSMPAILSQ